MKLREEVLQDDIEVIFHYQDVDFDEMVRDKKSKKKRPRLSPLGRSFAL